ncbi:hypothetical protein NQ317_004247 [Molorchus minor]|uniref:AAA+ ATPase domain-containing protein n=1 Tax=Molorchus minor TaxID=1323400 RepID=A0ABQ9K0C6_9CUCU|nr:hypothetical protein NQ317_004247 [Molorchus minor]
MSQESDSPLLAYNFAIESFELLESLLQREQIDLPQIMQELQRCYQKVDDIISQENMNGSYLIDLFQLKHHVFELKRVIQNKIEQIHIAVPTKAPLTSTVRLKEKATGKKQIYLVESTIETPRSNGLKDIAGLWEAKKNLKSLIILPRNQPQLFINRKSCNSVLLFGPPGTGKTRLVHALAHEASAILHSVSVSDMLSPLVGQTEKNVQSLFDYVRNNEYFSILFMDEIDGFCRTRHGSEQDHTRRLKTELMCQMSKMEDNKNMFLICATNCPWDLDTAFLRRFQKQIYIPLPNAIERLELLQLFTKDIQLDRNLEHWEELINKTEGFSGSDISNLVNSAFNIPLVDLEDAKIWKSTLDGFYEPVVAAEDFSYDNIICCELSNLPYNSVRTRPVQISDLIKSLESIVPTISITDIKKYQIFINKRPYIL